MARIRSIKPDFFTSEKIAALPLSTRLTFIGLWTHVDDNGVTVDNPRLIMAAIWPLEDDPRETLQRTSGDLARLSEAGLIWRYEAAGRQLLFVTSWDEHQKVSHPGKPRYPRPAGEPPKPPTSRNAPGDGGTSASSGGSPEALARTPESLRPEQGAGSREQGYREQGTLPLAIARAVDSASPPADEPAQQESAKKRKKSTTKEVDPDNLTVNQRAYRITNAYAEAEPLCKWPAVNAIVIRAVKDGRYGDEEIRSALLRIAADGRSVTLDTLRIEMGVRADNVVALPVGRDPSPGRPSTTDQRVNAALALADRFEKQEVS